MLKTQSHERCPACGLHDCARECPIGRGAVLRHVYDEITAPIASKLQAAEKERDRALARISNIQSVSGDYVEAAETIEQLSKDLSAMREDRDVTQVRAENAEHRLDGLRKLALEWYHGEDCDGYGEDKDPEWPECNCGVGDVLRAAMQAGVEIYIDRTPERYGLSRILEPTGRVSPACPPKPEGLASV